MRLAQCAPRAARLRKAPALEPLELLCHRPLDDHSEIATRNLRAHQGPKPLELVLELGARSELDPVAGMAQRLDKGGPRAGDGSGPPQVRRLAGGALPSDSRRRLRFDSGHPTEALSPLGPPRAGEPIPTPSGQSCGNSGSPVPTVTAAAGGSGSFRISAGASGRGAISAISSSIWRRVWCVARPRSSARFSVVKCEASLAIPVRWRRPSASMSRRTGCSRDARATVIRR
jgi:hypothetical protein